MTDNDDKFDYKKRLEEAKQYFAEQKENVDSYTYNPDPHYLWDKYKAEKNSGYKQYLENLKQRAEVDPPNWKNYDYDRGNSQYMKSKQKRIEELEKEIRELTMTENNVQYLEYLKQRIENEESRTVKLWKKYDYGGRNSRYQVYSRMKQEHIKGIEKEIEEVTKIKNDIKKEVTDTTYQYDFSFF